MITVVDNLAFQAGDRIVVGGHEFRLIARSRDDPFLLIVALVGWRFWRDLVMYRVAESLKLIEPFIVVLLNIWRLADWDPVTRPTWSDIYLVRWLYPCSQCQKKRVE